MRKTLLTLGAAVLLLSASIVLAGDVVVLRGGARIDLKQPPVRQGNNVLLTRADGTLFSVPDSEIDWKATAAAKREPAARPASAMASPAETPAEAARLSREAPKARVKITDADVNHVAELPETAAETAKNEASVRSGMARLEVSDYSQEKSGTGLIVHGNLRNVGATTALGVSLSVSAMDATGKGMGTAAATLSKGDIESGESVAFSATLPVADKVPDSIRFVPLWKPAPLPAAATASSTSPGAPGAAGRAMTPAPAAPETKSAPAPVPTPYGRGLLYAPPAASAPTSPPADGKSGYIPGAARKEDQPKPPE